MNTEMPSSPPFECFECHKVVKGTRQENLIFCDGEKCIYASHKACLTSNNNPDQKDPVWNCGCSQAKNMSNLIDTGDDVSPKPLNFEILSEAQLNSMDAHKLTVELYKQQSWILNMLHLLNEKSVDFAAVLNENATLKTRISALESRIELISTQLNLNLSKPRSERKVPGGNSKTKIKFPDPAPQLQNQNNEVEVGVIEIQTLATQENRVKPAAQVSASELQPPQCEGVLTFGGSHGMSWAQVAGQSIEDRPVVQQRNPNELGRGNLGTAGSRLKSRSRKAVEFGRSTDSSLKSVPKVKRVFVSRLDPSLTSLEIKSHLQTNATIFRGCIQLKTKYDSYSSFCVECGEEDFEALMSPDLWPRDSIIAEFRGMPRKEFFHANELVAPTSPTNENSA
ncbi:hypothetical protein GE061_016126 [Apolygus lucorum]|uniref:Uncharacterized protein n=1 Tax=Apolygus lucorum TaxID=248454 RepID=A0A8S9XGG4_APOLU|nr:hypothetical protein GE061_016126 [Apolygus lucorum]